VTHDQAEAMATSDRIAVLNRGRLVQVGRPAEIFDRPRTRFVAEFVGKANILTGQRGDDGKIQLGAGLALQVARDGSAATAGEVAVCLRPHNVQLIADEGEARRTADNGMNIFTGSIERRVYFGEVVDYTIDLAPQAIKLRVIASPAQLFEPGQRIFAAARPAHCVEVSQD
ncbi:MAG TPA: TOBE domain-containing protein, partial [Candidatus Binatus sp.]|nr:TOBE domain-containing protein [Candidatus Binatus sp.]